MEVSSEGCGGKGDMPKPDGGPYGGCGGNGGVGGPYIGCGGRGGVGWPGIDGYAGGNGG